MNILNFLIGWILIGIATEFWIVLCVERQGGWKDVELYFSTMRKKDILYTILLGPIIPMIIFTGLLMVTICFGRNKP